MPAMTCLKYQVYLFGSEAITYLNAFLWVVTEPALWVIRLPPTPHYRQPSPSLYGSITFTHLEENSNMVKLPYLCEKARGNPVWLKGHGNESDFLGFFQKSIRHRFLTLNLEPFWFGLRIRGDICNRKMTPRLAESGSRQECQKIQFFSNL